MPSFPFYKQLDAKDCGPTCLRMIARFYGRNLSLQTLRDRCFISREGVSLMGISEAAESIGFKTLGVALPFKTLSTETKLPAIIHWRQNHFVVVYKIKKHKVYIVDPELGLVTYTEDEFKKQWLSTHRDGQDLGICLLIEPTPDFYKQEDEKIDKSGFRFLLSYLKPYRKYIIQLILGLMMGSVLLLLFPFLTQAIVDYGINNKDLGFITLILAAQLVFIFSRTTIEFIRGWILLHLSTRINVLLISDFLIKLMKLPVSFFEIKLIGDILQRIGDHQRIEEFLTSSSLNVLFSLFNLLILSIVLAIYNTWILLIFLTGTALYIVWIIAFMKQRRVLDIQKFKKKAENHGKLIQVIQGIREIKLNDSEKKKRWDWENIQASLFKLNVKSLKLNQLQSAGGVLLREVTSIIITFFAAREVVHGEMTLGMLLAVSFILGQLNAPVEQFIQFMHGMQNAKISLERLGEVHENANEEEGHHQKIISLEPSTDIVLKDVSFQYEGPYSPLVLENICLTIPAKKITAIVGVSGSGKTTLLKLLLGFYKPVKGSISIDEYNLNNINLKYWRSLCGVVLQDGYLFSDTLASNIAMSDETINTKRLAHASRMAHINQYIESLPLGYNTKIGMDGVGLSGGQKQRILIARAVYKNPMYFLLDESTSSLDAENEKVIVENLREVFVNKTVIIVAHRLSTVKNADQIVVLDGGKIVEIGTHSDLVKRKGSYFQLIKNQLELGT